MPTIAWIERVDQSRPERRAAVVQLQQFRQRWVGGLAADKNVVERGDDVDYGPWLELSGELSRLDADVVRRRAGVDDGVAP